MTSNVIVKALMSSCVFDWTDVSSSYSFRELQCTQSRRIVFLILAAIKCMSCLSRRWLLLANFLLACRRANMDRS